MKDHVPVLVEEVLKSFRDKKIKNFLDATVGAGGHASKILKEHLEIERYIAIDQDKGALKIACKNLVGWKDKIKFYHSNFENFEEVLEKAKFHCMDGMLFDLGVSSMQLDEPERGFSFREKGPLDMRMDKRKELTAEKVVNEFPEKELAQIFRDYGEEPHWRLAAKRIVEARKRGRITTTEELVKVLGRIGKRKIHPATLIFQALRIFVNDELKILEKTLEKLSINYVGEEG